MVKCSKIMRILRSIYTKYILVLILSITSVSSNQYDDAYKTAFRAGKVRNLVEYVQQLSITPPGESAGDRRWRLGALKYFLTTGGEGGFLQRPATGPQREVLIKAVAVMTVLQDDQPAAPPLDVVAIRESFPNAPLMDATARAHLMQVQAIAACTLITIAAIPLLPYIDNKSRTPPTLLDSIRGQARAGWGLLINTSQRLSLGLPSRDFLAAAVQGITPETEGAIFSALQATVPDQTSGATESDVPYITEVLVDFLNGQAPRGPGGPPGHPHGPRFGSHHRRPGGHHHGPRDGEPPRGCKGDGCGPGGQGFRRGPPPRDPHGPPPPPPGGGWGRRDRFPPPPPTFGPSGSMPPSMASTDAAGWPITDTTPPPRRPDAAGWPITTDARSRPRWGGGRRCQSQQFSF